MKTVIITGGSSGIGASLARIFLSNNYKVIVIDVKENNDKNIVFEKADVCDFDVLEKLSSKYKDVDIIINNAAVQYVAPLKKLDNSKMKEMIDVNIIGVLNVTKAFIKNMKKGLIINVGSTHADVARVNKIPYDMSKSAMQIFTKELALELEEDGIRTLCVEFGAVKTPMNDNFEDKDKEKEAICKQTINHILTCDDCAKFIYALTLDEFKYMNGSIIKYDCGRSLK